MLPAYQLVHGLISDFFFFKGRAPVHPERTGGFVGAVLPEMSGERSPGSSTGGRETGPQAVSERKPGAEFSQPGQQPADILHAWKFISIYKFNMSLSFLQELNNRLSAEITRMRSCFSGETALSPITHGKDVYELEV